MRIGSLCTGYGGLDMAVASVFNAETAWVADIDKHASQLLAERLPGVPNLGDLTAIDWESESLMPARRADALAESMYDDYCQGLSLEKVGAKYNRTRQAVYKMFRRRGWNMRPIRPSGETVEYGGRKYGIGAQGYYRCTTGDRHLLHRQVWADVNGAIPDGYEIHHQDHNKLNNDIGNLQLLTKAEHAELHAREVVPEYARAVDVLTAGYP